MKKASQRKSQNRQKRRQAAERKSAAAAASRVHPRQGHAGRVTARGGTASGSARRGGASARTTGANWRLPAMPVAPRLHIDAAVAYLSRPVAAITASIPREDRETLALLLTPFLVLAAAIAMSLGIQLERSVRSIVAAPPAPITSPLRDLPRIALNPVGEVSTVAPVAPGTVSVPSAAPLAGSTAGFAAVAGVAPTSIAPSRPGGIVSPSPFEVVMAAAAHSDATPSVPSADPVRMGEPVAVATLPPSPVSASASSVIAALDPSAFPVAASREDDDAASPTGGGAGLAAAGSDDPRCVAQAAPPAADIAGASQNVAGENFGLRLAAAARGQLDQFVIYNDAYRRLSYPMGDVPKLYGVCTDVVIRAYRALGVDLQVAVQRAGVGAGDTSIDHRRTETLRRFFARAGKSLPVTSFAEDYEPGDIVTYDRPQNSGSRSHIAVVSDVLSASGRPMIVHNRGWGPQLEDGLFVDRITGHYRFDGVLPGQSLPVRTAGAVPATASGVSATAPPARRGAVRVGPTSTVARALRPASLRPAARPAVPRRVVRSASAAAAASATAQH